MSAALLLRSPPSPRALRVEFAPRADADASDVPSREADRDGAEPTSTAATRRQLAACTRFERASARSRTAQGRGRSPLYEPVAVATAATTRSISSLDERAGASAVPLQLDPYPRRSALHAARAKAAWWTLRFEGLSPRGRPSPADKGTRIRSPDAVHSRAPRDERRARARRNAPPTGRRPRAPCSWSPGRADRDNDVLPAIRAGLLDRGIAAASFDKRGVGESTGDWRDTGPVEQAADVAAQLACLRETAGSRPSTTGALRPQPGRLGGARGRRRRPQPWRSRSRTPAQASRWRNRNASPPKPT